MNNVLTPAEQSTLILAAYAVQSDASIKSYLEKVEKIIISKLSISAETERLLKLSPKQ